MSGHYVYLIETPLSDRYYVGQSKDYDRRWKSHLWRAKSGKDRSPVYDWMRKYGADNFEMVLVAHFDNKEDADNLEVNLISSSDAGLNLHPGGGGGYSMSSDPRHDDWKRNLSKARVGGQPALGMSHTDENKKLFGEFGRARWDKYGRYPEDVVELKFKEANAKYGISRTQYYRIKNGRRNG